MIEQAIAKAEKANAKFAFRIMPANPAVDAPINCCPSDFPALLAKGFYYNVTSGTTTKRLYAPDYNDPIYIERAKALFKALGTKYGRDPRIAFVEVSCIGTWGEANYAGMPKNNPSGAVGPEFSMVTQLIDAFVQHFEKTIIIAPIATYAIKPTSPNTWHNALEYALRRHPSIGMFTDSLGDPENSLRVAAPFVDPYVNAAGGNERWKVAPVRAEFYGAASQADEVAQITNALAQVQKYHITAVSDGNVGPDRSNGTLQLLSNVGKASGYRYQLDNVRGNSIVNAGSNLTIVSAWKNVGVTPVYEPWVVTYQLRPLASNGATTTTVSWQGRSSLDLRALLPSQTDRDIQDSFHVPTSLKPGKYQLVVMVQDPYKFYKNPLALASAGILADGSYHIATITIRQKRSKNQTANTAESSSDDDREEP